MDHVGREMRIPCGILLYSYAYNGKLWRNTDASLLEVDELTVYESDGNLASNTRGKFGLKPDSDLEAACGHAEAMARKPRFLR